jgi:hypothetical protein
LAPVPHADGVIHVQPISIPRSSGRGVQKLVLPIGRPERASSVAKCDEVPNTRARTAPSNQSANAASLAPGLKGHHVQISSGRAASKSPAKCSAVSGSSTTISPTRRGARSQLGVCEVKDTITRMT